MTEDSSNPYLRKPNPGWYPDPSTDATERFWDGDTWTGETRPDARPSPAKAAAAPSVRSSREEQQARIVCQFCQQAGGVTVRNERRAKRKTATRIGFGVMTLGGSLGATGVSKKGTVTVLSCSSCGMKWDAPKAQP